MKIFKAEPITKRLNEHPWNASTHRGWVVIRAENERKAISIAASEFRTAATKNFGEVIPVNPWRGGLAKFTEMTDAEIDHSNYSTAGEESIIDKE